MGLLKDVLRRASDRNIERDRIKKGLKDGTLYRYGSPEWQEQRFHESGLDDSYYEEWMSNPHWSEYNSYANSEGFLSDLSSALLGTNANERNAIQAKADALAYEAKLLENFRSNNYNHPDQQASRERSAGFNPALMGIDNAGSDSGVDIPEDSTNMESPMSDIETIGSVVNGVAFLTNLASTIIGIKQGFAQLKGQTLENEGIEISNNNSIVSGYRDLTSYAEWAADNFITPDFFDNFREKGDKYLISALKPDKDSLLKEYLPDAKPFQKTVFYRAFEQRLRSNALNYQSMDEFAKAVEARRRAVIADSDLENGFTISVMECQKAQADCDAALARWKSELMDDATFEELWKSNEFASLRESVSVSNANAAAADISYAGSAAVLDDPEAMKDVTAAAKQAFRTALEQLVEEEASAILGQTNAAIIQNFYDTYAESFGANWKYRPLSPDREKLDIALGIGVSGFSQSVSVLDLLLKRKYKSKK